MTIKEHLFYRLSKEKDKAAMENWLYNANSLEMEALLGKENYLYIISEWYSNMTLKEIKDFIWERLPQNLRHEYDSYAKPKQRFLKARCINDTVTHQLYLRKEYKKLNIGHEYAVIEITHSTKYGSFMRIFEFISDDSHFSIVPAELFEIEDKSLPEGYVITLSEGNLEIHPREFAAYNRKPVEYSIWEDFYNDHPEAIKTVEDVLERLGFNF